MDTRPNRASWSIVTICLAVVCYWTVVANGAEPPADTSQASPTAEKQPAEDAPAAEEADLFKVPDGSVEDLLAYIEKLKNTRADATDYEGFVTFRDKVAKALIAASEKVLAAKPNDEQRSEAVHTELIALSILAQSGDADAEKQLAKLPGQLKKDGYGELARDAEALILQTRFQTVDLADSEDYATLLKDLKAFLASGPIGRREAGLVMRAVQGIDMLGNEQAAAIYRDLGKQLASSDDEAIASFGARLEGSARRLQLVGKKMVVKGVTLDGKPFDWSKYKGKVVLVDFWATWCGPCLAELPNVRQEYDAYHDRGFDVVGISLDDDRQQLIDFVKEKELPWTMLFDADAGDDSMAAYYGVFGIPTTILVGADGKVVTLDARGPALGEQLEKLLGPAPKDEAEPGEQPSKADASKSS